MLQINLHTNEINIIFKCLRYYFLWCHHDECDFINQILIKNIYCDGSIRDKMSLDIDDINFII